MAPAIRSKDARSPGFRDRLVERQPLMAGLQTPISCPVPQGYGQTSKKEDIGTWRGRGLRLQAESGEERRAHLAVSSASS